MSPIASATDAPVTTDHPCYDEYKESGVDWLGEVPSHWEIVPFRYYCDIPRGKVDPESEEHQDRTLIGPNHVEQDTGNIRELETAADQGASSDKYLVEPGDLIYSKIRPELNKVCIAEGRWLCSADMYPIKIRKGYNTRFLKYLMLSRQFVRLMVNDSMRVAMPKVNRDTLEAARVLLPPLDEQRAIAAYLDRQTERIEALIEKKEQLIDLLEEKRTSLISRVVTKGLDDDVEMQDSGVEWLGEIPAHWETGKLKHLCQEIKDGLHHTPPKVNEEEGIPFISTQHVRNREIDLENATYISKEDYEEGHPTVAPEPGDVLITLVGSIGHAAILTADKHPISSTRHVGYVRPSGKLNAQYLLNYTESSAFERFIGFETSQVAQPSIYLNSLGNHTIPVPPVEEQMQIAKTLQRRTAQLSDLIGKVGDGIECLREYRTSLFSAAVTGQIDVREATEKPVGHQNS